VQGCLDAGAENVLVVDGHGAGAIDPELLHPAAQLLMGRPLAYPFGCDESFDCALIIGQHAKAGTLDGHLWHMIIGQHAKAGTLDGHLWHTGSIDVADLTINDISLGELGSNMLFCAYYDVPVVTVTGDEACCREARELVPNIETAAVKRGINRGAAIHLHPTKARELIREASQRGVERRDEIGKFWIDPPYVKRVEWVAEPGFPPRVHIAEGEDLIEVLKT